MEYIAPPDKYFYTSDKKVLTNLYQLSEYIADCNQEKYSEHVNKDKNDFASWVQYVLGLVELADEIRRTNNQQEFAKILNEFVNSKKENYSVGKENHVELKEDHDDKEDAINNLTNASINASINDVAHENNNADIANTSSKSIAESKFREWTDEELEKFSKFGFKNQESDDEKAALLLYQLNELMNMVKDLRKSEKNVLIPDLMLRILDSKIAFYKVARKEEDYDKIISMFNEIKREIDYCSQETPYSFTDEIIKTLELQRVVMKKI